MGGLIPIEPLEAVPRAGRHYRPHNGAPLSTDYPLKDSSVSELTPRGLLEAYPKVGKHHGPLDGVLLLTDYFRTPAGVLVYESRAFYGDVLGNCMNPSTQTHDMEEGELSDVGRERVLRGQDRLLHSIREVTGFVEGGQAELEKATLRVLNDEILYRIGSMAAEADWTDAEGFNELAEQLMGRQESFQQDYREHVNSLGSEREKRLLKQLSRYGTVIPVHILPGPQGILQLAPSLSAPLSEGVSAACLSLI